METTEKSCCFSGCRPFRFSFGYDEENEKCIQLKEELKREIVRLIHQGVDTFYTGMSQGTDIWCAQIVLELKRQEPQTDLHLIAVVPYEGQADRWSVEYRERYFNILAECDDVINLQTHYSTDCFKKRNEYLITYSSHLIAVCDERKSETRSMMELAVKQGLEVVVIHPETLRRQRSAHSVIELFRR
ncbi:MAG: SLOG family protein [Sporolactobacillus sp.]